MQGQAAKLIEYMDSSSTQFVIPVYQRNYDWKQENCKQLFDDLVKIIKNNRKSHFFGSIVAVHCDGSFKEFQIIDGQQRLTTISLLFLAMHNLIKTGFIKTDDSDLADQIYERFLVNKWQKNEKRLRLKPIKEDQNAFAMLFKDKEGYIPESNLTLNYRFFCEQICKERISVDELFEAISKLEIINITLNNEDNPQLIFESLNSTGLALSEGDKIRNFILMGLPTEEQNEYYERYWNPIELCTNYDVSAFIRDYLSVKQQAIPAMSRVYYNFKNYVEEAAFATEELLKDILAYARRYQILLKGITKNPVLNACIYRLNRLETTVTRPFFLEVLRMHEENVVTLEEVREIFLTTENYLFRRMICNLPTNSLNKIFLMLHREIVRFDGTTDNYTEKFKYALLAKTERGEFPRDDAFVGALSERQIYQMNSKNKIYIFERIENSGTLEDKDIYRHCDNGTYSIEHIMPQHLTPAWVEALGEDALLVHEKWLHRLANLTLTAYNSKYSNNSFDSKRNCENGFSKSGLRMNQWIGKQFKWDVEELEARNTMLMKAAINIWPIPESNYQPETKQLDCYSLEEDIDFSGREIISFEYKNTTQPVSSWITMQEQILKILHEEDKSVLSHLAHTNDSNNELSVYVSDNPQSLRGALQLDEGIYLEKNTSTSTKISMLRKFFKEYGVNTEDLLFYLKDATDDNNTDEAGSRYELRRKYWTFALPYIKEKFDEHGPFANVNPTKENWLSGFVGISGFNISCVANYNQGRVELVLAKSKQEDNKNAFDYLLAKKQIIEDKLGSEIEWKRSDNTKGSYISKNLPDIGIINENNWIQLAKFHAEWSKRFYDVFASLLQSWMESEEK